VADSALTVLLCGTAPGGGSGLAPGTARLSPWGWMGPPDRVVASIQGSRGPVPAGDSIAGER